MKVEIDLDDLNVSFMVAMFKCGIPGTMSGMIFRYMTHLMGLKKEDFLLDVAELHRKFERKLAEANKKETEDEQDA